MFRIIHSPFLRFVDSMRRKREMLRFRAVEKSDKKSASCADFCLPVI
jgi:hypothetical protein